MLINGSDSSDGGKSDAICLSCHKWKDFQEGNGKHGLEKE